MSRTEDCSPQAHQEPDPDLDVDTSLVQLDLADPDATSKTSEDQPHPTPLAPEDTPEKEEYVTTSIPQLGDAILVELNKQRAEGRYLDFQLDCNGVALPCHRCVLAASSPYFDTVLSKLEDDQHHLSLDNLKPFALETVLDFIYTSRIELSEGTAASVLGAACLLEFPAIVGTCCSFLKDSICPRNCLGIFHLSQEYGCSELQQSACQFALENPYAIFEQDEFLNLPVEHLVEYISEDALKIEEEDAVYKAVMKWVGHDESNRASDLQNILQHVRLPLLSNRLFSSSLELHPLIINCDKCRQLVKEARHLRDLALKGKEINSESLKPRPSTTSDVLVVVGGMETNRKWVKEVMYYDPATETWDSLTTLPFTQTDYSVTSLGGNVYVSGGFKLGSATAEVWCYKVTQDKWVEVASLKLARFNHASTGLDGMLYVVGGETDETGLTEIERYDPQRNAWEVIGEANPTESNLTVAGLNQKLYIIGWLVHARLMCAVQCFDLQTKECMIQPCSGLNRQLFPIVAFQESIYILGGSRVKEVAVYDPDTYQSVKAEPMRYKRNTPSATVIGCHLYVTGGELRHHLDKVEVFDPVSNSWRMVPSMPKGLCFHGCVGVKKYLGPPYIERQDVAGRGEDNNEGSSDIIPVSNESARV